VESPPQQNIGFLCTKLKLKMAEIAQESNSRKGKTGRSAKRGCCSGGSSYFSNAAF